MTSIHRAFPEIRRAVRQFKRGKLDRAAAILARHRAAPWHERSFCIGMFAERAPLEALDLWCRFDPTCTDAWLLRGIRRAHWAWQARGGGRASNVEEDMWPVFFQRLEGAESDLLWAAELAPEDPEPHARLISVAMGLSHEGEQILERLRQALQRDPEHYTAYSAAAYALAQKWCGSHEEMFEVAREAAGRARASNDLAGILIEAHVERWVYYRFFDQDPEGAKGYVTEGAIRHEVTELFDRTLAAPSYQLCRHSHHAWNNAAFWFWLTRDRKRLTLALQRIGKAFKDSPWHFIGKPDEAIAAARRMAAG